MRDERNDSDGPVEDPAVESEPIDKEDGGTVVIRQQNAGPGNQVGGGEFKNPDRGKSPEEAEADQEELRGGGAY